MFDDKSACNKTRQNKMMCSDDFYYEDTHDVNTYYIKKKKSSKYETFKLCRSSVDL